MIGVRKGNQLVHRLLPFIGQHLPRSLVVRHDDELDAKSRITLRSNFEVVSIGVCEVVEETKKSVQALIAPHVVARDLASHLLNDVVENSIPACASFILRQNLQSSRVVQKAQ